MLNQCSVHQLLPQAVIKTDKKRDVCVNKKDRHVENKTLDLVHIIYIKCFKFNMAKVV